MVDRLKKTDSVVLVEEHRGPRRATGISSTSVAAKSAARADPEVWERGTGAGSPPNTSNVSGASRWVYRAGQIGALLRREGLYSWHLTTSSPARSRRLGGAGTAQARPRSDLQNRQTQHMAELSGRTSGCVIGCPGRDHYRCPKKSPACWGSP